MSLRKTAATAQRVLAQLRHDPRTVALVMFVPALLIVLLRYIFDGQRQMFNGLAPMILGIFPLIMMFLVTSIATLRERTSGTLDRLMTAPISKLDFIFGYAIAFSIVALLQGILACLVTLGLLGVTVTGGTIPVLVSAVLAGLLGTALGLFISAFATSEFQAVQLVMPIMMPQVLLCGLFLARDQMARSLQLISNVLPLTYSVDAMKEAATHASWTMVFVRDLLVVAGCAVIALVLGSLTIRRQE